MRILPGLLNNLPVDVAQNMGAQLTVAVYLQTASFNAQQPLSTFSVLGQSLSVMIAANELKSMQMADVLVTVPLNKYTTLDYDKAPEMIRLGYEAAENKHAILSKLAVNDNAWKQYVDRRERRTLETPVPQFVEVTGTTTPLENKIQRRLNPDVGKPVDKANLQQQFTRIAGSGRFATLGYSMTEKDGKPGLLVSVEEKPYSPPIVRPLIIIDGTNYNEVLFSAGARITFLDYGSFGSELRNDVIVGSLYELNSEYFHPFTPATRWFVAPQLALNTSKFYFYYDNHIDSQYRKRQFGGALDFGYTFSNKAEARLGYQSAYQRYSPVIGDTTIYPIQSGRIGVTRFHFNLDLTDDPVLPMRGISATYRGEWWDSNTGTKKQFPAHRTSHPLSFSFDHEIVGLSVRGLRDHSRSREHRDPSIFSGGRTAALCLWRERADYQSVLLISDWLHSPARKAAPIFRRQHLPGHDLRSGKNLLPAH